MDKEGFDTSSSAINILQKPVFPTRNASQKRLRKAAHLVRATPREEGSTKPNTKLAKRPTVTGTKNLHNAIRRYISAVGGPTLVRPCPMETKIFMQSSMRKLLWHLTAKKRRISTSLRLYPSCLVATRMMTAAAIPWLATSLMKT